MIFKCDNCGGIVIYDPVSRKMKCEHCDSEEAYSQVASEEPAICVSCGSPLNLKEYTSATKCEYCDNYVIVEDRVEGEKRPHVVIPFKVGREAVKALLIDNWGKKLFIPPDFLSETKLKGIRGVYVPFWLYDYLSKAHFEGVGVKVRSWTTGDTRYTETSRYRVVRDMEINMHRLPIDASIEMQDGIMDLMEPYAYDMCEDFEEKYLSGYEAEVYNMTPDLVESRAKQKAEGIAENWLNDSISGYSRLETGNKNKQHELQKTEFALLPVWLYDYVYKNEHYVFYINGQSGKIVGKAPFSKERMLAMGAALFGAVTLFVSGLISILGVL